MAVFDGEPKVALGCPACESRDGAVVVRRNGFSFVRCPRCSSLYVDPRPNEKTVLNMYQTYPDLASGRNAEGHVDLSDETREARYRLKCLLKVASGGRLLDVGFGTGAFLALARQSFDVIGIDVTRGKSPTPRGLSFAKAHGRSIPFSDGAFSVVTAFEVLEHLFEIRSLLREVKRILTPHGVFVVQTGDPGSLVARISLGRWTYLLPPVHLNVLSREAILDRMTELGFEKAGAWSFGRAPTRTPLLRRLPGSELMRPFLDLAGRAGLIGQILAFRKTENVKQGPPPVSP